MGEDDSVELEESPEESEEMTEEPATEDMEGEEAEPEVTDESIDMSRGGNIDTIDDTSDAPEVAAEDQSKTA